jgi:phage terminase large subunit-like protein
VGALRAVGWHFACPDWERRLTSRATLIPDLPLDEVEAERAVAMFNMLRLPDVPGQPTMRDAAGDWQRDLVRAIFGSLIDGVRMVPEIFELVPKKNSKTTGGAAITLTGLLMNGRPRAEFIYVGPTQEVADLAFQQTIGMIEADEYLARRRPI